MPEAPESIPKLKPNVKVLETRPDGSQIIEEDGKQYRLSPPFGPGIVKKKPPVGQAKDTNDNKPENKAIIDKKEEVSMPDDLAITEADRVKHEKIERAKKFEKDVNTAVESIPLINAKFDKLNSEICEGPDCLKAKVENNVKYINDINQRISGIEKKVSEEKYRCDGCGEPTLTLGDSFCPVCGTPVTSWDNDDGTPAIPGWKPFSERGMVK